MQAFQITFCGFNMFPHRKSFLSKIRLTIAEDETDKFEIFSNLINIIIIELPKLKKIIKRPAESFTSTEIWSIFFKYANDNKYKKLFDKLIPLKGELKMAFDILNNISMDDNERYAYLSRQKFETDRAHVQQTWLEKGEK
jgi:hypothetical protein